MTDNEYRDLSNLNYAYAANEMLRKVILSDEDKQRKRFIEIYDLLDKLIKNLSKRIETVEE